MTTYTKMNNLINDYAAKKARLEALKAEVDALAEEIKADSDGAFDRDGTFTGTLYTASLKAVITERLDTKTMKKELPEFCRRYTRTATALRLNIKAATVEA